MERDVVTFTPCNDFFVPLIGPIIATLLMGKNALDNIFTANVLKNITNFTFSYH